MVGRADVYVVGLDLLLQLRLHGSGLRDLLGYKAVSLKHVEEVRVATKVELVGAVKLHAAVFKQTGEHAMNDGRPDLGLDVIADDRHAAILEPFLPVRLTGDEHGDAVDEADAGRKCLLYIPLGGVFGTDWEVADHHVNLALTQDADDVSGLAAGGGRIVVYGDHV